ncbi:MAG: hypothetical protein IT370_18615 [Deltaproteobacteria bacterium]|nr:hypothetical protein [Deltaproteobacteria bacterium]
MTTDQESPGAVRPTGCCPPFDPRPWHEREVVWHDKLFVKEHVHSLLHVPVDMAKVVTRATRKIELAGAQPRQPLMLADDSSLWGCELFLDVTRPVPGAHMVTLSGTFMTKVYDGPFRNMGKWAKDMHRYVQAHARLIEKLYFAYTTCPSCAKAYGHNYVVAFAKVA